MVVCLRGNSILDALTPRGVLSSMVWGTQDEALVRDMVPLSKQTRLETSPAVDGGLGYVESSMRLPETITHRTFSRISDSVCVGQM